MKSIGSLYQSGDWKGEKHVPVIHVPESVKALEDFEIKVLVGEEIPHPNTLEHYIAWIKVYYLQEGNKFPVEIGSYTFQAHGESEIYPHPYVSTKLKVSKPGTIIATSYCNIHGLWENSVELKVQ